MSTEQTTTTRETVIQRIHKLFALAGNNPSEQEAQALLLEHGIAAEEIEVAEDQESEQVKDDEYVDLGLRMAPWQWQVGRVVCRNFRCSLLRSSRLADYGIRRAKYSKHLRIIGMAKDAAAASEVLRFVMKVAPSLWEQFKKTVLTCETRGDWNYLRDSYYTGFVAGLESQYKAQVESKALTIVVPHAVIDRAKEIASGSFSLRSVTTVHGGAYAAGKRDGANCGRPHYHLTA